MRKRNTTTEAPRNRSCMLGRREMMKLGTAMAVTTLSVSAQSAPRVPGIPITETGPGYKNDANRSSGNGPMDDTSRQIVTWVGSFSETDVSGPFAASIGDVMLDSIASLSLDLNPNLRASVPAWREQYKAI